jgi:thiol-disulfide isomerase/thioredoxin/outer membrane lipoprotein-sorting protein
LFCEEYNSGASKMVQGICGKFGVRVREMRRVIAGAILFLWAVSLMAQAPKQQFTDAKALLDAVAKNYAGAADGFRMEEIETTVQKSELEDRRATIYRTAIQGPGNLYRIDTRSSYGSYTQVSDGTMEWIYLAELKMYVERPVPQNWPGFAKVYSAGQMELQNAWDMRIQLEMEMSKSENLVLLPEETIAIAGRDYPCYVVHATQDGTGFHSEFTYWIDKQALVLRKQLKRLNAHSFISKEIQLPRHRDITSVYPVADFSPQTDMAVFRFTPPADGKKIATFEPDLSGPLPQDHPKAQLVGQIAPDVTLTRADGTKVALSTLRGKPVLLDFWATWCGPCIASMPSLHHIYEEVKGKEIEVVAIDEDQKAEDATQYLVRHKYAWADFHDTEEQLQKAFKGAAIPLTVLIDAQGKIVYYDFGGNEETLRRAIAALGPEFASVGPAVPASTASEAAKKN